MDGSNNPSSVQITGQIMVVAIIVLFVVVVFVIFLHLYAKWFWWRIEQSHTPRHRRHRRRLDFAPGQDPAFALRTGLDPAVLSSIPVLNFTPQNFKEGLECAVCLSELVQGEKARLLPKCNHGFHVDCIDMWFQSHSTCPLCRHPVALQCSSSNAMVVQSGEENDSQSYGENSAPGYSTESPNFPTNVLFWGNETQVTNGAASSSSSSTSSESESSSSSSSCTSLNARRYGETLVVDIPASMSEHLSSISPTPGFPEEESKSPMTTRLRSLKRLLSREKSREKRENPSSSSSSACDV